MAGTYQRTARTTANRNSSRMSYDRAAARAILDEAYHCALAFVVDGEPRVLPTLHVRIDDTLYLHGSTGSRPLLAARGDTGLAVCVAVTQLDGLIYARSQFHHSANYRSVVAHGTARLVTDDAERRAVLTALVEKVGPGRAADSRPPSRKELAETAVLALPLDEVSVRTRSGGVNDEPADSHLPYWAGVVPLRQVAGRPQPDDGVGVATPGYLPGAVGPWHTAVPLRGNHVLLEPLDVRHADALFTALDDAEVWRHLTTARPRDADDLAGYIAAAVADPDRVAWVQRDARTGAVVGTTSYYDVDPGQAALAIGLTTLARPRWRTAINTEAKVLLLSRAFDELGAERVCWHTDLRNERSQLAIERLGATREGVLRRHRRHPDGSWRDTVLYAMTADQWPAAGTKLRDRLSAKTDRAAADVG